MLMMKRLCLPYHRVGGDPLSRHNKTQEKHTRLHERVHLKADKYFSVNLDSISSQIGWWPKWSNPPSHSIAFALTLLVISPTSSWIYLDGCNGTMEVKINVVHNGIYPEVEEVEKLLLIIQGKRLNADLEDRMVWKESKDGIFSVKSCFNSLDHSSAVPFPWRIIWSTFVPTKVGFFAWEASWGRCSLKTN
ncbi:hypothetical protein CK203_081098 [Vitis vinifera]|uniref:Reverse transcriptase zinc-binding domain-containing protein n=1 Tax=Vitis vinifera TaxID=29760 RepID=A0A438DCL2_VITVI|nr:hypothetical protein CK203_081098 [Vitis vinifera]